MLIIKELFFIDHLSLIMAGLISFVSIAVALFSSRYLKGDRKRSNFFLNLTILAASAFILVCADHILVLLTSWIVTNFFLSRLMLHKREWEAARQSSILALKNFILGTIFLGCAFATLYLMTHETSIQTILHCPIKTPWITFSSLFLLLAAMTQSALWPFHRWLISSLNSPTPVSAIMHAGIVNGGGFLIARFAPILSNQAPLLNVILIIGIASALIGTLWKLMQSDIKRMLACSTMGQMGFMIAQCGLGLFPAAVAHLCWHGLFKAYLFLASGSAAQEKRLDLDLPPSFKNFSLALICGTIGAYTFSLTSNKNILAGDSTLFLIILAMIGGTQFALPIVRGHSKLKIPLALVVTAIMGSLYGLSVHLITHLMTPLKIANPQPLNFLHLLALAVLTSAWLTVMFGRHPKQKKLPDWVLKAYVYMLNAGQPHPKTVTTYRNQYQF